MEDGNLEQELELDEEVEFVVLVDETGQEYEFEIIDELEKDGTRYLALLSAEDDEGEDTPESDELLLVKAVTENDEEIMVMLEEDDEFEKISKLFAERLEEFFEIIEDDSCSCDDCCDCNNCE